MERREFLKHAGFSTATTIAANGANAWAAAEPGKVEKTAEVVRGDMRYRKLGGTGEEVSIIGVGGSHIGKPKDEAEAIKIIRRAIDAGVTFMDNSWDYNDGVSELRMGKALRDGYRKKVFLMTKFDGRTKDVAAQQIDESLGRRTGP